MQPVHMNMRCTIVAMLALVCRTLFAQGGPIDGVTFAHDSTLYAPLRDVASELGLSVEFLGRKPLLGGKPVGAERRLPSGQAIVPIRDLASCGARIEWDPATQTARVTVGERQAQVSRGEKRVVIDKTTQTLEAYQGERLVLRTHVSTGREGHNTPNGQFEAGPVKELMHHSRLYDDAPMPWSVQVDGDVFIHGYAEVPTYPASHGCIRVPLTGVNPAEWFYSWIDIGTPITIQGQWKSREG